MSDDTPPIDLPEVVRVLASLGADEDATREELAALPDDAAIADEVAALTVESEAGLLMPLDAELGTALFDLVDALRQGGVIATLGQTANAPALLLGAPVERVFEVQIEDTADVNTLVQAVARVVPDTHKVLIARAYDAGDALPLAILDRGSYAWLRAALGGARLDATLRPAAGTASSVSVREVALRDAVPIDFDQRFGWHLPQPDPAQPAIDTLFARIRSCDPRVAWPEDHKRPPGDDFYELASALAAEPLAACLHDGDNVAWANLLYAFALVTSVGAHWDLLAARLNPGMSAQGVLGLGQLTWSWFIFEALGARYEAARVGVLLDTEWVAHQERSTISARQRAWFDLGALLRGGKRRPSVRRVHELLPLLQRDAWKNRETVRAALAVHTEPEGDQLTHQPLFHVWPAPLYALARRAGAMDLLPQGNPFLSRPLRVEDVDMGHELVVALKAQLARLDTMDDSRLPPLLDPLPVIVDVRITEVDAKDAHGRTLLAAREEAEHHVVAPHGGRAMQPGEVWLMEVQGARPARARARYDDLGEVSYNIALPTGEWLSKADRR